MSYLNVPRIHFAGRFQADPSTINNNDNNWDPNAVFTNDPPDNPATNDSVYWNPNGTHNFKFVSCTVRGAANDQGPFSARGADPVIGAAVMTNGEYPAKIVDLDPDNQMVSQIWGLQVSLRIPAPNNPTTPLASVTGTMPPTAFADLWNRAVGDPTNTGMATMCATYQSVLEKVQWVNATASPLLAALQAVSPSTLSFRFHVDSFQADANQPNFTFGRVVGTLGPVLAGEPPRSTPRRLAPLNFYVSGTLPRKPSIFSKCGPAGATWDANRRRLILDLGNCVPTQGSVESNDPVVPEDGWPIPASTWQLSVGGSNRTISPVSLKSGARRGVTDAPTYAIPFSLDTYLDFAGIVEIPIPLPQVQEVVTQPLTIVDATNLQNVAQEDAQGRYVEVSLPYFRLNPGDTARVILWATQFGRPWSGAQLDLAVQPPAVVNNPGPQKTPNPDYATWLGGAPTGVVGLASAAGGASSTAITVVTGADGTAGVDLIAGDPGAARMYSDGQAGPDGQVYFVSGPWQSWGQIFLFSGAPINLLVFSGYTVPQSPTWDLDVGPLLGKYARMYPYMKSIIDLGDFETVVANQQALGYALNLPPADPHHMPIVRDLSRNKLAMINLWFKNGMPKCPTPPSRNTATIV